MYQVTLSARALEQYLDAAIRFFEFHPGEKDYRFSELTDEAFTLVRLHPRMYPRYRPDRLDAREYRRVVVWKYVYIYTIDDTALRVKVVYIHHVAADPLPPLARLG